LNEDSILYSSDDSALYSEAISFVRLHPTLTYNYNTVVLPPSATLSNGSLG